MRRFVVFEGIDGVGKSTLVKSLGLKYQDKTVRTYEPWDRELVDTYKTSDPEMMAYAFAIDRKAHLDILLSEMDDDDKVILCDRYVYSNLAYQMYYGVRFDWIMSIQPLNLIWPEVVIHLECDPEIAARRGGETNIARLRTIQNLYNTVYGIRNECPVYVINVTDKSENEVFTCVEGLLKNLELL